MKIVTFLTSINNHIYNLNNMDNSMYCKCKDCLTVYSIPPSSSKSTSLSSSSSSYLTTPVLLTFTSKSSSSSNLKLLAESAADSNTGQSEELRIKQSGESNIITELTTANFFPITSSLFSTSTPFNNNTDNLSNWCTEYTGDILQHLIDLGKRRKKIEFKSSQICYRTDLVEMIRKCGQIFNLGRTTIHLAVYLLDVFMDAYKIPVNQLNLVTLACVLLSSKIEENDLNTPKIIQLNSLVNDQYEINDFKTIEKKILQYFDYNILHPTIATFTDIYLTKIYTIEDYQLNYKCDIYYMNLLNVKFNIELVKIQELLIELTNIVLQDCRLTNENPSIMASASLYAARKIMNIYPLWPINLEMLTKYRLDQIAEYGETLISFRNRNILNLSDRNLKLTPDSGYLSESCSDENYTSETDTEEDDDNYPILTKRRRLF